MAKGDFRFHFTLRVRWSEGDAQGIVYNARYMDYLDVAQAEYFRNLGLRIYDERMRAYFDTVTAKATLEFKAPARVDEMLDIYTRVSRIGTTSLVVETEIYRDGSDELLTRAEVVYVDYDAGRRASRRVPEDVRRLIGHFEATGQVLPIDQFPHLPGS